MISIKTVTSSLSLVSLVGVAVTGWLSAKGAKKVDENSTPEEKRKAYTPAVVSGVVTGACIIAGQGLNARALTMAGAATAYAVSNREEIKKKLAEEVGPEKAKEIVAKADETTDIAPWEGPSIEWTGKGTELFMDGYSGRLFYSSREDVQVAIDSINQRYHDGEELSYNDYYRELHITETGFGDNWYWSSDVQGDEYIQFYVHSTLTEHGEKMYIIDILTDPVGYGDYEWHRRCR